MKRKLLIAAGFLLTQLCSAQVLFTETFDNFTLGDIATDIFGQTPGQGGWYTLVGTLNIGSTAANFQIENETNKGKILKIISGPVGSHGTNYMYKKDFELIWNQRTQGNNVLKFEYEMFVPNYTANSSKILIITSAVGLFTQLPRGLINFAYNHTDGRVYASSSNGLQSNFIFQLAPNNGILYLTKNQWHHIITYIDYDNNALYVEIPALGIVKKVDVFDKLTPPDTMANYPPTQLNLSIGRNYDTPQAPPSFLKFDNIKITALNAVPPHILSAESFLAQKFNLYPNPATNVVNITNSENLLVQQIALYDTAGKLITTENYNNKTEIQLNVEHLASGTYLLHLKTNEGTAVKKLVKK